MASAEVDKDTVKLSDVFEQIWSTYEKLENTSEPSNSDTVQVNASYILF